MKFIELFWLFMTIFICLVFITNYESLAFREKVLYLIALLLSTFLYSFRRFLRLTKYQKNENLSQEQNFQDTDTLE